MLSKAYDSQALYDCGNEGFCCRTSVTEDASTCCVDTPNLVHIGSYKNITTMGKAVGPTTSLRTSQSLSTMPASNSPGTSTSQSQTGTSTTSSISRGLSSDTPGSTGLGKPGGTTDGPSSSNIPHTIDATGHPSGLSAGADAGIGIGVALGIIAAAVIGYSCHSYQTRKKEGNADKVHAIPLVEDGDYKPEQQRFDHQYGAQQGAELETLQRTELPSGFTEAVELPTRR